MDAELVNFCSERGIYRNCLLYKNSLLYLSNSTLWI